LFESPPGNAVVMFGDQSDVGLHPPIGAHWGECRRQDKVRSRGKNQRICLFGALDAHSHKLYAGFWDRKNSEALVAFLRALLAEIPDVTVYLVLDNSGVRKSRMTQAFLGSEEAQRLRVVFLPACSPLLNPIERTWNLLKGRIATNQWRDSLDRLITDFIATMKQLGTHTRNTLPLSTRNDLGHPVAIPTTRLA